MVNPLANSEKFSSMLYASNVLVVYMRLHARSIHAHLDGRRRYSSRSTAT